MIYVNIFLILDINIFELKLINLKGGIFMLVIKSHYFYGNKISDAELETGYINYQTLAKAFNCVLANDVINKTLDIGYWEQISGWDDKDNYPEIFQYFIVDFNGAEILQEADEIVYYNEELDLYVWGVTHYGTSWDYVLTNIKIELN